MRIIKWGRVYAGQVYVVRAERVENAKKVLCGAGRLAGQAQPAPHRPFATPITKTINQNMVEHSVFGFWSTVAKERNSRCFEDKANSIQQL